MNKAQIFYKEINYCLDGYALWIGVCCICYNHINSCFTSQPKSLLTLLLLVEVFYLLLLMFVNVWTTNYGKQWAWCWLPSLYIWAQS